MAPLSGPLIGCEASGSLSNDAPKLLLVFAETPPPYPVVFQALGSAIGALKARSGLLSGEVEDAVRSSRVGRWFHLRHTTRYALLLDEAVENAYAVKALTNPLHEIAGAKAVSFEAGIVEYKSQYVCDGIVLNPLYLGPGMRESLKDGYARIKGEGRFRTSTAT